MSTGTQQSTHLERTGGNRPVTGAERLASLDYIRGIAVMGILAANIVAFGQPFVAYMWPDAFLTPHGETSDIMWAVQFILIDGKMRGLFTLLFGASMMLFLEKAWARGSGRKLQAKRLFWLLIFGIIHFYFIWRGDILILYSIAGFAAMALVKMSVKPQLILGLAGYAAGAILYAAFMIFPYLIAETSFGDVPEMAEVRSEMAAEVAIEMQKTADETEIIQNGTYIEYVSNNFVTYGTDPLFMLFLFAFETLPLMLIGMAFYRMGMFSGGMDASKMRLWGWLGVVAGTLLTLPIALWALDEGLTYWGTLAAFVGMSPLPRLPAILGLMALLALYGAGANGWLGQRISAAGRMAFSNYLGTSILMLFVFHGWAGGLYGELTRGGLYMVMALTWVIMLAWSKPWLERFKYGPLEWLWRCLTYGTLVPLKRET